MIKNFAQPIWAQRGEQSVLKSAKEGGGNHLLPQVVVTKVNALRSTEEEHSRQRQHVGERQTPVCMVCLFARFAYLLVAY